jgi:hypothetical protein
MQNITLISTDHSEKGKCNSDELLKILEVIKPEVIFEEEFDHERFQNLYNGTHSIESLEVQCVKKYLKNHDIKHIPVDIEPNQFLSFEEWNYMFEEFGRYDIYKKLKREIFVLIDQEGFAFLNSKKCLKLFDKVKIAEKQLLEFSGFSKNRLLNIWQLFQKEHDCRENAWIENIYKFSKEIFYNQAVFLIGYAHRRSVEYKILEFDKMSDLKLNWNFYNES